MRRRVELDGELQPLEKRTYQLAIGISSWLGYRAAHWDEVRIVVQMEIVLTVLSGIISLYSALFAGAPLFIWVPIGIFVVFAVAWIYFYRQAQS